MAKGLKAAAAEGWAELVVRVGNTGKAHGLTLADAIADLARGGMSPSNIEATLLADLEAGGGQYFGQFINGLKGSTLKGVGIAQESISMVAYDDGIRAASKALDAGDMRKAREALDGVSKADLSATGSEILLTWITVMDGKECSGCAPRHEMTMTDAEWAQVGKPRWGTTPCRDNCRCELVPASAAVVDGEIRPDLKDPLDIPKEK